MTVAELQGRMSAREFAEWIAYHSWHDPIGSEPAYWRTGVIASVFANAFRKKGRRRLMPADFMPKLRRLIPRRPRSRQTPAEMWSKIVVAFGGSRK